MTPEKKAQIEQKDREFQIRQLTRIYDQASFPPAFHRNPKYCFGEHAEAIPYIAFLDIMKERCIIRAGTTDEDGEIAKPADGAILAQYKSIEELVADGWRLD